MTGRLVVGAAGLVLAAAFCPFGFLFLLISLGHLIKRMERRLQRGEYA